jgi:hypothetical protein
MYDTRHLGQSPLPLGEGADREILQSYADLKLLR